MEGRLAYNSGSSSEESDESPKKKLKVTESDKIVIYAGSNRKTENGKLESPVKHGACHDSVNSKGLFIVRTRLPPRVYSLSPKSSIYKDVHRPSGVTV